MVQAVPGVVVAAGGRRVPSLQSATISYNSAAITLTYDFDSFVTPSDSTSSSTRRAELLGRGGVQVSGYFIIAALTVGVPSLCSCVVGVVAVLRAKPEDIPDVVRGLNRRPGRKQIREIR